MIEWIKSKLWVRPSRCLASIVDPEAMSIEPIVFDGIEESIPAILGYERIEKELFSSSRVYFSAENAENERLYGFVIEHTGGIVNRGRCLVVGNGTISYRIVPGYGAEPWTASV